MSSKAYQIDEPTRGEFTAAGRRITFELEPGQHVAKSGDDELVLEHLTELGIAKPAEKRGKTEKAAPAAESTGA